MDLWAQADAFSRAIGTATDTSSKLEHLGKEISEIDSRLRRLERDVETHYNNDPAQQKPFCRAVDVYDQFFRQDALPKVALLYEATVNAAN